MITIQQLGDSFDTNQVAAEKEWKGKRVQFTSSISNITDSGLAFHNASSKQFSLTQVACRVSNKNQLLPLANGQTVTVQGTVGDQTLGVISLSNCEVVP